MTSFDTPFTRLVGVRAPVVQAPMSAAASPALAAAVSGAGGLGMISGTWLSPDALRAHIREVRALTDRPFGVNLGLAWPQEERIDICVDEGVGVISLFWGHPGPFVERARSAGACILQTVGSAAEALAAVEAGVDVVVAQGWEAGGHLDSRVGGLALIPNVVDVVGDTPVVAAGGIADGRGLAAVLSLGGSGVWMGTRFLLSEEAAAHSHYKDRLLAAGETDTVYSTVFDVGWSEAPHRTLRNDTVAMWEAGGCRPMGERPGEGEVIGQNSDGSPIERYHVGFPRIDAEGDVDAMALYAGQSVGMTNGVLPAADIVSSVVGEAREILDRLASTSTNGV